MTTAAVERPHRLPATVTDFLRIPDLGARLASIAPRGYDGNRLARELAAAIRESPALRAVTVDSMLIAASRVASLGLSLAPASGECYLIPRKDRKVPGNVVNATLQIGRNGWKALALQHVPRLVDAWSHAVYKNDKFKLKLGPGFHVDHEPQLGERDRGPLVAVYAIAEFDTGAHRGVYMTRAEVASARAMADPDSLAWKNFEAMMWEKVALKRLCRMLAAGHREVDAAIQVDDQGHTLPPIELTPELAALTVEPEARGGGGTGEGVVDLQTPAAGAAAASEKTGGVEPAASGSAERPSDAAPGVTYADVVKAISNIQTAGDRELAVDLMRSYARTPDAIDVAALEKTLAAKDKELAAMRKGSK